MNATNLTFWIAVLVAAVVGFGVGALWYSPLLFAKSWMAGVGKKPEDVGSPGRSYAITFVAFVVIAYTIMRVLLWTGAADVLAGALRAGVVWLGFVATSMAVNYAFGGRSLKLYVIDAGYFLVSMLLMGGILGAFLG